MSTTSRQTSFARAMQIAKGTVSVVDGSAGCFERIWCVYELYNSLVSAKASYTYDLVTATTWEEPFTTGEYYNRDCHV